MADKTGIQWTDATWNPIAGCSVVSPGCTNCYAMRWAPAQGSAKYRGLTQPSKAGAVWTGEVRLWEPALDQPLRWARPRRIFVNSMSDLFHESIPSEWIRRIFDIMRDAPQHTYQILTKRAERQRDFMQWWVMQHVEQPPSNWWLGVSVEDRVRLPRLDDLRATPASLRFVSFEPLLEDLGPVDLRGIDWVVVGGESGSGARPMHPDWARRLRDQCQAAGVSFFFKQWGEFSPVGYPEGLADRPEEHLWIRVGKKAAGRTLDGRTWEEYPQRERGG